MTHILKNIEILLFHVVPNKNITRETKIVISSSFIEKYRQNFVCILSNILETRFDGKNCIFLTSI